MNLDDLSKVFSFFSKINNSIEFIVLVFKTFHFYKNNKCKAQKFLFKSNNFFKKLLRYNLMEKYFNNLLKSSNDAQIYTSYKKPGSYIGCSGYFEKMADPEKTLCIEIDLVVFHFKKILKEEKDKFQVKKIKEYIFSKYELSFEFSGFYYRELDPLSKKFNGEYRSLILKNLQNIISEYYCDYFLLIDDAEEYELAIKTHSFNLTRGYLMRSFYILLAGYGKKLPISFLTSHLTEPVESMFDKENASSIRQLKLTKNLKSLLNKNGVTLSNSFIFEIIYEAMDAWEKRNPKWVNQEILQNSRWYFTRKYKNETDCYRVSGVFNLGQWCNGEEFPKGHRFAKNNLPILRVKSKWITIRPDNLLEILGEQIKFSSIIENHIREKLDLPKIGEGKWISEIAILNKIKSLTKFKVIHQWSPDWLGRQRIDIAIPELELAFEFNGKQHYEPVDFFGGTKGYIATIKRDKLKKKLCKSNGIKLIEIKYDLEEQDIDLLLNNLLKKSK